jgi:hypothetical protein
VLEFRFGAGEWVLPLDLPMIAAAEEVERCCAFLEASIAMLGLWVVLGFSWQAHGSRG